MILYWRDMTAEFKIITNYFGAKEAKSINKNFQILNFQFMHVLLFAYLLENSFTGINNFKINQILSKQA